MTSTHPLTQLANLDLVLDNRLKAKFLFWLGWRISDISSAIGENERTVQSWKTRDDWEKTTPSHQIERALTVRLMTLVLKNKKNSGDYKEMAELLKGYKEFVRIERYQDNGLESELNPKLSGRAKKQNRKAKSNHFSDEQIELLETAFMDSLFDYQKDWYKAGHQRTRIILKSRQIGATWYFAREALLDAVKTGRNQIFLSASKAQAHIFKEYIKSFAYDVCQVELTGDPIVLSNGADLKFLGTNYRTAQGHHGNFYFDEFFWTHGFNELNKVASGMAMHKKWRKTYFSTPSTMAHEAYPFWTGERFNRGKPKDKHLSIDVSHDALQKGRLCEDKLWRQIVTIMDASEGGCDLFDVDELKFEYSAEEFANLLMCQFIDDGASVFPLALLQSCLVDSWVVWQQDFKPFYHRPLGNKPVWIGYDPAATGDSAGLVVVAVPQVTGGVFRVVERVSFRGMDFKAQAGMIQQMTKRYQVSYIGLDTTGMGTGVAQLVRQFFPNLTEFSYSPEIKTRLVLKTMDVIQSGRLQYDTSWVDLTQSLMSIKKTLTPSQKQMTFIASRSEQTGHADLAWALMHALYNEPLEGQDSSHKNIVEIYT